MEPERRETIRQGILHHGAACTPWQGFDVVGWPVTTNLRGMMVAEAGRVVGEPGRGRVLDRHVARET